MGNCRDCKWWKTEAEFSCKGEDYPMSQGMTEDQGECQMAGTRAYAHPEENHPESKAIASGYHADAVLCTMGDFGCVQFEVKAGSAA